MYIFYSNSQLLEVNVSALRAAAQSSNGSDFQVPDINALQE